MAWLERPSAMSARISRSLSVSSWTGSRAAPAQQFGYHLGIDHRAALCDPLDRLAQFHANTAARAPHPQAPGRGGAPRAHRAGRRQPVTAPLTALTRPGTGRGQPSRPGAGHQRSPVGAHQPCANPR